KGNQLFHAPARNQITVFSLIAHRYGIFSISRLPQTSTLSKNLFAFLSSWRTLGGSVCAYSRGVAPLRNFSSISFRTGKKAVYTFQSSSEIVGYGMASFV